MSEVAVVAGGAGGSGAIAFLLSDDASFVTDEVLCVDGCFQRVKI